MSNPPRDPTMTPGVQPGKYVASAAIGSAENVMERPTTRVGYMMLKTRHEMPFASRDEGLNHCE